MTPEVSLPKSLPHTRSVLFGGSKVPVTVHAPAVAVRIGQEVPGSICLRHWLEAGPLLTLHLGLQAAAKQS